MTTDEAREIAIRVLRDLSMISEPPNRARYLEAAAVLQALLSREPKPKVVCIGPPTLEILARYEPVEIGNGVTLLAADGLRELIERERSTVIAVHDERIMSDGRPAFAWWNEIQMLRADRKRVDNLTNELKDMFALMGIVRVYLDEKPQTGDMVITVSRLERVKTRAHTLRGLIEEYIAIEREKAPKP